MNAQLTLFDNKKTIKESILHVLSDNKPRTYEQIGNEVKNYGPWSHGTIDRRVRELMSEGKVKGAETEKVIDGKVKKFSYFWI